MRALMLFVIGLIFGATGGFLAGGGLSSNARGHDHGSHDDAPEDAQTQVRWDASLPEPQITLAVTPDSLAGVNLAVAAPGFTFLPEMAGGPDKPGIGHAHVYVNGHKITRIYGPWLHLPEVESGDRIRVTLNSNSHADLTGANGPIAAEITVP